VEALNKTIVSITDRLTKSANGLLDVASEPEKLQEEVEGLMEEFGEIWDDDKNRGLRYGDEGERERCKLVARKDWDVEANVW
jgi:hypothetical protein